VEDYTLLHLVGDALGVLDAVGAERAVVVGHDWGAPVAWHTALLRPDRVQGVVALSVPLLPRSARPPNAAMARRFGADYYQLYFQRPGLADRRAGRRPARDVPQAAHGDGGTGPAPRSRCPRVAACSTPAPSRTSSRSGSPRPISTSTSPSTPTAGSPEG
jgi:pimeloyl-ACP methyl ester carboxylesterase